MKLIETAIPDVKLVELDRFGDDRGFFVETYDAKAFAALGITTRFVQDSFSLSKPKGTVRGLHYQLPPHAQAKLVRVPRGSVLDVALDLRAASPTFGRHVAVTLRAEDWRLLFIPEGFAHGFCTLEDDTEVAYKMSDHYVPDHYRGVAWDDPDLGIAWPVGAAEAVLSEKDRRHPRLRDIGAAFQGGDAR